MIIQCDQCQTKFKLPDEKLKPAGVKVRCSHCKHVFTVMPPEPPEKKAAEPEEEEVPVPSKSESQPQPEPEPQPEEEKAPGVEEESTEAAGGMSDFDFGDFDETSAEEEFASGAGEEGEESSELDFSSAFDEESTFSEEEPEGKEESGFGFEAEGKEESAFDFGEGEAGGEEAGFGLEEESAGPTEFEFDEESAAEDFGFGEEPAGDEFEFDEGTGEEGEGGEFDFGDAGTEPDAFDFGDENPFAEEEPAAEEAGAGEKEFKFTELPTEEGGEPRRSAAPAESLAPPTMESEPSGAGYFEEEPLPDEAPARPPEPSGKARKKAKKKKAKKKTRKSPVSRVLLLVFLLLVVLLGGVGYLYWQQGEVGLPAVDDLIARLTGAGSAAQVEGNIDVVEQSGRYVTNREVGTLLVIEGRAVNRYPVSRANIRVQAVLYDAGGRTLRKQNAYCGNRLTDQQLRDLPYAKIEESMNNAFGEALSNIDVPPGKSLPFTVVLKGLPAELDSFSVDVLDSQPASAQ